VNFPRRTGASNPFTGAPGTAVTIEEDAKMKLLITPIAIPAGESHGGASRARTLATAARARGHEVAFCAAEDDPNYRPVEGVKNFAAPLPRLFGLPPRVGRMLTWLGQLLGVQQRIASRMRSFERALSLLGATDRRFFARDVETVRHAMRAFEPDVVITEHRISAIVAARLERIAVAADYSYPLQPSFASSPEHSAGVRAYLHENGLPAVHSALELFDWADLKFVASSYDLEPIDGENVIHVGPLQREVPPVGASQLRDRIIAYVGTGALSARRVLRVLTDAFDGTSFHLYLASQQLTAFHRGRLHVQPFFDFDALLPGAVVSIHHGGQNSVMKALIHGVPQLVVSGGHFERGYNADSVVRLQAGARLDPEQFTPEQVKSWVNRFAADPAYREKARAAGQDLLKLGGAAEVLATLERRFQKAQPAARQHAMGGNRSTVPDR
jgi:UDP:flavonoid glycosyltransferase YjiC (YdhE family)